MGKKTNLKASLSNFQEKQKKAQLQKTKEAAKKATVKQALKPSAKSRGKRPAQRVKKATIPVAASDTILLIGEGNFSFARALFISRCESIAHLPPSNVTATAYDSEEACYEKYPDAQDIVKDLRERGVTVIFDVDARRLDSHKELKKRRWKRIIWNFPHAGKGISDQDRNVLSNQLLILDFLKSAGPLLEDGVMPSLHSKTSRRKRGNDHDSEEDGGHDTVENSLIKQRGTILMTLRNGTPYTLWDLPRLAKKPPIPHSSSVSPSIPNLRYIQLRSFTFDPTIWHGYEHRMTKGWVEGLGRGEGGTEGVEDRTWEFCLADQDLE
ncbi:hypothetical protein BU17DRAFT_58182 [Hysterangium stoloniferum]|nr:hypothetical protein BU17DRAFT_58182 [Hysterangium stoloniferum]